MPKIKKGLDYFDIHTDINDDEKIELLEAEFGIKGFGIWVKLLRKIYADEGFYMNWNDDTKLLFAKRVGESGSFVDEVVKGAVRRGLFDEPVFNNFEVLTSRHIQEKYFSAISRRKSDIEIDGRYLLISTNADIIKGNANIKVLNVNTTEQRRGEESKGEKRREQYCASEENPEPSAILAKRSKSLDDDLPDWEEWWQYAESKAYTKEYAQHLFDSLTYRGWKNKDGQHVENWQAYLNLMHKYQREWIAKQKNQSKQKNNGTNEKRTKGDRHVDFYTS